MKNKITLTLALTTASMAFAQVGINNSTPKATFDISAKASTGKTTAPEGIIIPNVDRERAQSMTGVETSTLIYVNSIATGTATGNIDAVGYYYYNGTAWVKLDLNTNLYNTNGSLLGNRTVSQAGNTLAFTGTAANAFSVNKTGTNAGVVLSVDAANKRVGIGTAVPAAILAVQNSVAGNLTDAFSVGINNCGSSCGQQTARNITLFNGNGTNTDFASIDFIPSISGSGITGAAIKGTDRNAANGYAGIQFWTRNATNFAARMTVRASGNVGIGTEAPTNPLHVNSTAAGALRLVDGTQGANRVLTSDANGVATWKDLPAATVNTNIYTNDGTLTASRVVTQGTNTLAFNGNAVNGFSVDGATLSVDSQNNRVGIGTTTPNNLLDLGNGNGKKLALWNSTSGDDFYGLGNAQNVLQFFAGATATGDALMTLNKNGRVGIGTIAPAANLHAVGTRRFENATAGSVSVGSVLTATDNNGTAEWQPPRAQVVRGTMGGGYNLPFSKMTEYRYTGSSITLPPGKWLINVSLLVYPNGNLTANDWMFVRSTLSEENLSTVGQVGVQSADVSAKPTLMSFQAQGPYTGGSLRLDTKSGSIFINNTSSGNKTYRYIVGGTESNGVAGVSLSGLGGSWAENSIIATAIN